MPGKWDLLVDGGEGEGAEIEGVAGIIVNFHGVCWRPFARLQDLPRPLANLHVAHESDQHTSTLHRMR